MCIRDSHLTPSDFAYICLKHADVKQERIAFLIDEMGQYLTSQNNEDRLPVSYTHLDVYKRQ